MNEALKKDEKYQKKYMRNNLMLTLLLKKDRDKDIIAFLWEQDNRSVVVRRALREYIKRHERRKLN